MKIIIYFLLFSIFAYHSSSFADEVGGFDGFKWGSSRNDIVAVKGDIPYIFRRSASWDAQENESVGGYRLKTSYFMFEEGCSELKETISENCSLEAGVYELVTKSQVDFEMLTDAMEKKYGKYIVKKDLRAIRDNISNIFLSDEHIVTIDWTRKDESSVQLVMHTKDKDYVNNGTFEEKGISSIFIKYQSSGYNKRLVKSRIIDKSF